MTAVESPTFIGKRNSCPVERRVRVESEGPFSSREQVANLNVLLEAYIRGRQSGVEQLVEDGPDDFLSPPPPLVTSIGMLGLGFELARLHVCAPRLLKRVLGAPTLARR